MAFVTPVCVDGNHFIFATRGRGLTPQECKDVPTRWLEAHRAFVLPGEALFVSLGAGIERVWPDSGRPPFSVPNLSPLRPETNEAIDPRLI